MNAETAICAVLTFVVALIFAAQLAYGWSL